MKSPSSLNLPRREGTTFSPSLRTAFFHLGRRVAEALPHGRLFLIPQRRQPSAETKSAPGHQRILPPRGSRQSPQRERGKQGTAGGLGGRQLGRAQRRAPAPASCRGTAACRGTERPGTGEQAPGMCRASLGRAERSTPRRGARTLLPRAGQEALGKRPGPLPAASSLHPASGRDNTSAPLQSRGTFPAGATHQQAGGHRPCPPGGADPDPSLPLA